MKIWSFATKMTHLTVATYQDVPSYGRGTMHMYIESWRFGLLPLRWHILQWPPAKMLHLMVGDIAHVNRVMKIWSFATKMTHLTVATCQDAPSCGRGTLHMYIESWRLHILQWLPAKMLHLMVGDIIEKSVKYSGKLIMILLIGMC